MEELREEMVRFMRKLEAINQPASQAELDKLKKMAAQYQSLAETLSTLRATGDSRPDNA